MARNEYRYLENLSHFEGYERADHQNCQFRNYNLTYTFYSQPMVERRPAGYIWDNAYHSHVCFKRRATFADDSSGMFVIWRNSVKSLVFKFCDSHCDCDTRKERRKLHVCALNFMFNEYSSRMAIKNFLYQFHFQFFCLLILQSAYFLYTCTCRKVKHNYKMNIGLTNKMAVLFTHKVCNIDCSTIMKILWYSKRPLYAQHECKSIKNKTIFRCHDVSWTW